MPIEVLQTNVTEIATHVLSGMNNEEALVKIVLDRRDPDLHAIRSEDDCR